jgi:hypothetical protein
MSDTFDPVQEKLARMAALKALRETPPFVPGPDPVVEAMREAQQLRRDNRLN